MKIFLVDDDDVINLVHTAIIKGMDPMTEIEVFLSGLQLLNRIKTIQPEEVPNYIFLDIHSYIPYNILCLLIFHVIYHYQ